MALNKIRMGLGFTMVELLIALAIFALVVTLAIGSFQSFLKNAQSQAAGQVLLQDAEFMEKYYVSNGCYTAGSSWPQLPYSQAPESGKAIYRIKLLPSSPNHGSANAYRLIAIPRCGEIMAGSACVCSDQDSNLNYAANSDCNNSGGACPCTN